MSDSEEKDFCWESCIWSPPQRKRKKDSKKGKKRKNDKIVRTDENTQKKWKKKNSKFKDAMVGRKEKRKGEKKKRLGESFAMTQGSGAPAKPERLNAHSRDELTPDRHLKEKSQKKKKVAFDLSSGPISVKRPKFVSLSPGESILLEDDAESCPLVHNEAQTQDSESQCTSEDINSQDLFITQKTFRASPSQTSSAEASDKAIPAGPHAFTPRDQLHTSGVWKKQHLEGSHKDSHSHQQRRKTVQVRLTEEEVAHPKKGKWSFQTQVESNLPEGKPVSFMVSPDLGESTDVAKSKKRSCTSCRSSALRTSMGSTSTQTENFFTTELCSYLNFCQTSKVTVHSEDLKPLDLSLKQRARKDSSATTLTSPDQVNHKDPSLHPCGSSDRKDVNKEPSGLRPVNTQGQRGTSVSPEAEPKSADMTASSEEEHPCRAGKLDLTQVRAVQMRLNESFFFKSKGERQSPRPESPLMKLVQGRERKSRKRR